MGSSWTSNAILPMHTCSHSEPTHRVDAFVWYAQGLANVTVGNDVIVTMGSDFNYGRANQW